MLIHSISRASNFSVVRLSEFFFIRCLKGLSLTSYLVAATFKILFSHYILQMEIFKNLGKKSLKIILSATKNEKVFSKCFVFVFVSYLG
jgi:hypothetical protein